MVTKFLRKLAGYILREELKSAAIMIERLTFESRQKGRELHELREFAKRRKELSKWLNDVTPYNSVPEWMRPPEVRFVVDYFVQGPMGPATNTNGVHPADRWGIRDFRRVS